MGVVGQMPWKLGEKKFEEGCLDTIIDANGNVIAFFPAYATKELREKIVLAMKTATAAEKLVKSLDKLANQPLSELGPPPKDFETCTCPYCRRQKIFFDNAKAFAAVGIKVKRPDRKGK